MMKKLLAVLNLATFLAVYAHGQGIGAQPPIFLKETTEEIVIDGELSEEAWYSGTPATNFWENFPSDSVQAEYQTEIYMTYDEEYLYIGAICHSPGDEFIVPSLRRDYSFSDNDNVTFLIDPFQDRTNAFVFGINALGVMREALISNGGQDRGSWNSSWDNKWRGESKIFGDFWSCEMAIPFSTLRYNKGEQEWFFNCYRNDTQSGTRSSWNRIPQNQIIMSLAYMSPMIWETPLEKTGSNISLIPFLTGSYNHTFMDEVDDELVRVQEDPVYDSGIGGDAKIALTPGLNLDLTVNPDFSQVEVDEQQLDLSRFELFFPERRQFFLENADLFGSFGDRRINPFFSRRIGIGTDTVTGDRIQIPILAGARLSGKLDNNWRAGLLNMQTRNDDRGGPGYNYTVAALQRKVFSRSNIRGIFVNKQTFGDLPSDSLDFSRYNRVAGLEYNLASSDNTWYGKTFYQHSFSPDQGPKAYAHGASLEYRVQNFSLRWEHQLVGEGFEAETGFVPRTGYFSISPEAQYFFYPTGSLFNQHGPGLQARVLWQPGFGKADHEYELYWDADLRNTGSLRVTLGNEEVFLFDEFDPTRTDATPLPDSTYYNYWSLRAFYRSDSRKIISYSLRPTAGEYFNGYRYGLGGSLTLRYQPLGSIELNFNYNYIDLPSPYASTGLFLIGPRIDLTFTRSLFLTTFLQYNDQRQNFNVNARLQWRFAPVSDFFLVYTDNYLTEEGFAVRNRAIVAKVTYWLNI